MKNFLVRHRGAFRIIQHLMAALIATGVVFCFAGSGIMVSGADGEYTYNLYESDSNRIYEDSYLFNNILGNDLSDVIKLVSIRSQLETKGIYDGDKKIDVTAYVNRNSVITGDYVTAVYKISDLLKWEQAGFTYETRDFSDEDSSRFLSDETVYTHLKNNVLSGGMNPYISSQMENNSVNYSVSGNSSEGGTKSHSVLLSRYQTINGKNIENLVSDWDNYDLLCDYVEEAAKDLRTNYKLYDDLMAYYNAEKSNLKYYITRTVNGKNEYYTNIDELSYGATGVDVDSMFKGYGRYLYYCPYEITYETNTLIKESIVRDLVKKYGYAYPDQMKLYVAVDTNNYLCNDDFMQGKSGFSKYMPYRSQAMILMFLAAMIYIALLYIGIRFQPAAEAEKVQAHGHKLLTEVIVIIGALIMAAPILVLVSYSIVSGTSIGRIIKMSGFLYAAAAMAFVMDIGFLFVVFNLVSKYKGKLLWKDSFLKLAGDKTKNVIVHTTDNGNIMIRSWIPYIIFIVLNFLLIKIGIAGIVFAAIMDVLVGVYIYRQNLDRDKIIHVIENIQNGDVKAKVDVNELHSDNISLANAVNSIGEGIDKAINTSMKDEKLKADLITNVSHDIKTPLTSIINYVALIKREDIENEKVKEYLDVLETKSNKLRQLTEDLVEVSKISSGNISISLTKINFVELVNQTIGEFYEKFEKNDLTPVFKPKYPDMMIMADPRHLWRVLENLVNNVCKYALTGTRVYMDMKYRVNESDGRLKVVFAIRNISANELNMEAGDLTERFIRGDVSRTTEGSGLGLSIAKNLTVAQDGNFEIRVDGDLFKVIIEFDAVNSNAVEDEETEI